MKCYFHEDRDAVGLCMDCGRALCRQCGIVAGGRLRCEPCYVEDNLGPQTETTTKMVQPKPEGPKELPKPLLGIGFLGSVVGVIMPVLSLVLQSEYPLYVFDWVYALLALFAGLWLVPQAVGFVGIYRGLNEPTALVAGVLGIIATVVYIVVGVAAAVLFGGGYITYVSAASIYIAPIYIVVTASVQAVTLLLVKRHTCHDMLLISTAVVLLAAASVSWIPYFSFALCVSNLFLALCFWKLRKPSVASPAPVQPCADPLKELL